MSQCLTLGGQCCCMKPRVKWCAPCQMWICRVAYQAHAHRAPDARRLWNARHAVLGTLYYRLYLLREGIA